MRRYLLLFVMSLACIIGMQAKITVVPPEESTSGAYELTFSSGDPDPSVEGEYASMNDLPDYVKNATSITIITAGDYTLSDYEVVQIMGDDNNTTIFPNLEELDMGDAVLDHNESLVNMKHATGDNGLKNLKYFVFPQTTTSFSLEMFRGNTKIEEVILLENPELKTIPGQAFSGCTSLSSVRIPDGITTIGGDAFKNCAFEAIHLPNTLTTISSNAFDYCSKLKSITIPASVTTIGSSAFQHNYSMTDVYVLGNNVTIPHDAFNADETYNFKYEDNGNGIVEYEDWVTNQSNVSPHPLRLHIPDTPEAKRNYINPCLQALNDPRLTDEILSNVGSNMDIIAEVLEDYHVTEYGGFIWDMGKYVVMDGRRYFTDGNAKFCLQGDPVVLNLYGGWRNFMLAAADVENKIWPDNRLVDSRWYSAVFPFNMTYDQLIAAYGNGTDVRQFTYVNEHTVNGKKKRTVTFNTEINTTKQGRRILYRGTGETYIEKGVPYMIHPGVRSYNNEGQPVGRTIAGVDVKEAQGIVNANTDLEPVFGNLVDGDNGYSVLTERAYIFKGSYQKCTLPANTFYLGYDPNPEHYYPLAFYVTKADITNGWTEFTSVVQKTGGGDPALAKGTMDFDFIELPIIKEDFGITTRIESVATKTGRMELQKVYNLSGQVVRENNVSLEGLSKGVYVVNGKKIVVR